MKRDPRLPGAGLSVSEVVADIYRSYYGMVWGILGRAGIVQPQEREDLAHDVFVLVHQLYPTRNPEVPIHAWVASITWNVAKNYRALERVKREALMPTSEPPEPVAREASPEAVVGDREYVLALIEGMDDDQRAVFDMHVVLGIGVADIALAREIPEGTARTRLRLAREHVKAAAARLEVSAARAERRPVKAMAALLPLDAGAWRELGGLFEDVPPDLEQRLWRSVCRTIAAGASVGPAAAAAAAGTALAGKTAAALLGAGALLGGSAVFLAMHLISPAPPSPSITRAPDVVAIVASAPSSEPTAAPQGAASATTAARHGAVAKLSASAVPAIATTRAADAGVEIDPEELRIIEQAKIALAKKNYDAVRAALRDHADRFPHGQLVTERKRMLAQMDREAGSAGPSTTNTPSTPDGGRAQNRMFGTDD